MSKELTVLVTGASGLIGSHLCTTFLTAGWRVFAQVHNSSTIPGTVTLKQNLAIPSGGRELCEKIDYLDCVINCAADQSLVDLQDYSSERAYEIFQVNVFSPIEIILAAKAKGATTAINISSIEALQARAGHEIYGATKSALEAVTRSLAVSLAPMRIHGLRLGLIGDDSLKERWPEGYSSWVDAVPARRIGKPQEVANLALAIANHTFEFATGGIIDFDGGKSASPGW
jgi:3-oxoacyl-[acyl-carrier protein] reductase